jgi:putative oxidoreductase
VSHATTTPDRAARAYALGIVFWMVVYALVLSAVVVAVSLGRIPAGPLRYAAALAPSVPIAGVIFSAARYLRDTDEYIRAMMSRRILWASGATFILTTAWGFLEGLAGAPHIELYWVFPLFAVMVGFSALFVRSARA